MARPKTQTPVSRGEGKGAEASKDPGSMAPIAETSDEACSRDRRCRINRMRRQNNARRYVKQTDQEAYALRAQRSYQDKIISDVNRLVSPYSADLMFNGAGIGVGLLVGYMFNAAWRLELGWLSVSDYAYFFDSTTGASLDGQVDLNTFSLNMTYLFRESWWSPYAGAGLDYGTGGYGSGFFDGFGGGGSSDLSVTIHGLRASAGLDFQFGFGVRSRLGVVYRTSVYTRAATSPGVYDDFTKLGLEGWYSESMSLIPEYSIGWAF